MLILNSKAVPISRVAKELDLPLHQIDTFTKWKVSLYKSADRLHQR